MDADAGARCLFRIPPASAMSATSRGLCWSRWAWPLTRLGLAKLRAPRTWRYWGQGPIGCRIPNRQTGWRQPVFITDKFPGTEKLAQRYRGHRHRATGKIPSRELTRKAPGVAWTRLSKRHGPITAYPASRRIAAGRWTRRAGGHSVGNPRRPVDDAAFHTTPQGADHQIVRQRRWKTHLPARSRAGGARGRVDLHGVCQPSFPLAPRRRGVAR